MLTIIPRLLYCSGHSCNEMRQMVQYWKCCKMYFDVWQKVAWHAVNKFCGRIPHLVLFWMVVFYYSMKHNRRKKLRPQLRLLKRHILKKVFKKINLILHNTLNFIVDCWVNCFGHYNWLCDFTLHKQMLVFMLSNYKIWYI